MRTHRCLGIVLWDDIGSDGWNRAIDLNGLAQPLSRTLPRTGFNPLPVVPLVVKP